MTKLSFCQCDPPMSESFWQKIRLVTHIFFDLYLFKHLSPVANFGQQSLSFVKRASINYFGKHLVLLSAFPWLFRMEFFYNWRIFVTDGFGYIIHFFSIETKIYLNFDVTWNQSHYMEIAQEAISLKIKSMLLFTLIHSCSFMIPALIFGCKLS